MMRAEDSNAIRRRAAQNILEILGGNLSREEHLVELWPRDPYFTSALAAWRAAEAAVSTYLAGLPGGDEEETG